MIKNRINFWYVIIIFALILGIMFLILYYNNKTVKVGIIDSVIEKKECANNIVIRDFTNKDHIVITNHGKTILSIINCEKNYDIYYAEVLDNKLEADIDDVVSAIKWCIENDVDIINMSFSTLFDNEKLHCAINLALKHNIIIVSSCYNDINDISYPANYYGVISVSTVPNSRADVIINDSSFGNNIPICNSYATAIVTNKICEIFQI